MNATHDWLDEAVDQIATQLVRVEDNEGLSTRILASLPDRSPWLLRSWIPRLAMTAALAAAVSLVALRTFDDRATGALRMKSAGGPFVEFRAAIERTSVGPELIVRRTIVERPKNDRRTIEDFDRSLAKIAALAPLALRTVAPGDLPSQGALVVEPLAIPDLPLTAESISPR